MIQIIFLLIDKGKVGLSSICERIQKSIRSKFGSSFSLDLPALILKKRDFFTINLRAQYDYNKIDKTTLKDKVVLGTSRESSKKSSFILP